MINSERLEDAITEIAKQMRARSSTLSRTKLVKLLYFVDLAAWDELGHTVTGVEWTWHKYGPYSATIVEACDRMSESNELDIIETENYFGKPQFNIASKLPAYNESMSREVAGLVRRVVGELGGLRPSEIGDRSYDTEPMQQLIAGDGERGDVIEFPARPPSRAAVATAIERYRGVRSRSDGPEAAEGLKEDLADFSVPRRSAGSKTI